MSRYLARLKSEKQATSELQKVQKEVFTVFTVPSRDTFGKTTSVMKPTKQVQQPSVNTPKASAFEQRLTDEAARRQDFCTTHRTMLGGECQHFKVIKGIDRGDKAAALDSCLLWRLIRSGEKIEQVSPVEIVGGVTVGDVIAWAGINQKADVPH